MTPLWQLDAAALRAGFARADFSPVEALEACLQRARECQPAVNAFIHVDEDGARAAARDSAGRWARREPVTPLDGIPVSLKDNLHARGMPTTWGSRLLRTRAQPADELPVARLRAAGAVLFGKTNLPEFALQGVTDNLVVGATRNPWNPDLTPGGSSGGAAAAVACGCGPLALATDGGGSTRRPASHCGVVGYKPSGGLVERRGGLPEIFLDYEVPGAIARTVEDAMAMAQVLAPQMAAPHKAAHARILFVPRFAGHPVDARIARRTREAADRLASLGHTVEESPPVDWAEEVNERWAALSASGLAWMFEHTGRFAELATTDIQQCGPAARATLQLGRETRGTALIAALVAIRTLERRMRDLFARYDAILTPATASLPWLLQFTHPAEIDGQSVGPRGHAVFTAFANAAGLPAIAVPGGFEAALPWGFQLVAARGNDASLLALALAYEQSFPRQRTWPSIP
jgi:aspartyl-tRNA(Asn)/glutamyl-tRNA(Gln) amidotransferase subunit A